MKKIISLLALTILCNGPIFAVETNYIGQVSMQDENFAKQLNFIKRSYHSFLEDKFNCDDASIVLKSKSKRDNWYGHSNFEVVAKANCENVTLLEIDSITEDFAEIKVYDRDENIQTINFSFTKRYGEISSGEERELLVKRKVEQELSKEGHGCFNKEVQFEVTSVDFYWDDVSLAIKSACTNLKKLEIDDIDSGEIVLETSSRDIEIEL